MDSRIDKLARLLQRLIDGEKPETVAGDYVETLGSISAQELAMAEERLVAEGTTIEDIQRANELHTKLVADSMDHSSIEDTVEMISGHPAFVFTGENEGVTRFIAERLEPDLKTYLRTLAKNDRVNLLNDARELAQISKHYERKENLFFPYLEKAGISVPPKVMWGVDDIIRDLLRLFVEAIEQEPVLSKRIEMIYERLSSQVLSMIEKENKILLPMLSQYMKEEDWLMAAKESSIIGYVFNKGIEGTSNSDVMTWILQKSDQIQDSAVETEAEIKLPSGNLTTHQLTSMLNTLPTDLTFVDSDDKVQYFSEGKHQVFTRTRTIIGRNVYLCHPPQLVPVIKKLIEAFRAGAKDEEIVLMRKGSLLNLVRYYAVRDEAGDYVGTLEVTEEISATIDKASGLQSTAETGND